jgi:hypothetical protein
MQRCIKNCLVAAETCTPNTVLPSTAAIPVDATLAAAVGLCGLEIALLLLLLLLWRLLLT